MNERALASKILLNFQQSLNRLDKIESKFLKNVPLTQNQKRHLKNLISGVLRHQTLLDWYISKLFKGDFQKLIEKGKCILRIGIYEFQYMDHIPPHATVNECVKLAKNQVNLKTSKLVNAILRNFLRQKDELIAQKEKDLKHNLAVLQSFPNWLIKRWTNYWGESFTKELCSALNELPVFTIRVNPQKIKMEEFENMLIAANIEFIKSAINNGCYYVKKIREIQQAGFFERGLCSVQDESAMIPARLFNFNKEDKFLDVCAAPGGKFTQILQENPRPGFAVAMDENIDRLRRLKENLERLDLQAFIVVADAKKLPFKIKFSKILLDVPCSGQGVIRKHPDIKWRRFEKDIKEFSELQKAILENTSEYLEKNGSIVYSTCSIDKDENENVVNHFLKTNSSFQKVENQALAQAAFSKIINDGFIRTFPNEHNMDGSFACLIKKTKS